MENAEERTAVEALQNLQLNGEGGNDNNKDKTDDEVVSLGLEEVEKIINYKFNDPELLTQAYTHASCREDESSSYERLEFVGDSVLNLLISKEHYFLYPELSPGMLTRLRAANVDNEKLARVAVKLGLHKYLRHKKPLLDGQIREFKEAIEAYPLHSNRMIRQPKALADIVESTIGAIWIDSGHSLDVTWEVVKNLLQPMITPGTLKIHPVTKLHELCQKNGMVLDIVDSWEQSGEIKVFVDKEFIGKAQYFPKKLTALNRAAEVAYQQVLKIARDREILRNKEND